MHDLEVLGAADDTAVGVKLTGKQLEQSALAAAVGADQAEALTGLQNEVETLEQLSTAECLVDPGRHQQPLGAAARTGHLDAHLRGRQLGPDLGEISHQALGLVDSRLGLGGPRLRSASEPLELPPHPVGEAVAILGTGL